MPVIEVTHGDGLGGSSFNYGFSLTDERLLMKAAVETATHAKIAALMVPGIGTMDDIRYIQDIGLSIVRVATHCTEADVSIQHFGLARSLGLETVGFLMMAHGQPPELIAKQARIMADAGCQCVYVVDSAGAMILEDVQHRVEAVVAELHGDAQVGLPRSRQPRHRRRQLGHRRARRGRADRRLGPRFRCRCWEHEE